MFSFSRRKVSQPVASLRLVSPAAATDGVGVTISNWRPYWSSSSRTRWPFLAIVSSPLTHPFPFQCRLSSVLYKFNHKKIFNRVLPLWRHWGPSWVEPRRTEGEAIVIATDAVRGLTQRCTCNFAQRGPGTASVVNVSLARVARGHYC